MDVTTAAARIRRADHAATRCAEAARSQRLAAAIQPDTVERTRLFEDAISNERSAAIWRAQAAGLRRELAR